MAAVVFDYAAWAARFPNLAASIAQPQAQAIFDEAQYLAIGNDLPDQPPSIVTSEPRRLTLFNLLVAHMATLELRNAQGGGAGAAMVGNVSSAAEGSVNVSMADYPVGTGKWFEQTQYGAQLWQMLQPLMRMGYVPGPKPYTGVPYPRTYWGR